MKENEVRKYVLKPYQTNLGVCKYCFNLHVFYALLENNLMSVFYCPFRKGGHYFHY